MQRGVRNVGAVLLPTRPFLAREAVVSPQCMLGWQWGARSLILEFCRRHPKRESTNLHSKDLKLQMSDVSETDSSIRQLPALHVSD